VVFGDVAFAQAPFASQGGKTLASALSESVAGLDSVSQESSLGGNIAETAAAAETVASLNNIMTAVRAEGGTATAVQSFIASTLVASQAETATGTATQVAISTVLASISETATATDAQLAITTVLAAIAETAAGSDTNAGGLLVSVSVSESATGTALITASTSVNATVAELASGLDANSVLKILNVYPAGLQLTVSVGNVLVWGTISTDQTPPDPNWQNIPT
jgi:hypothetical protein